jgi:hypothetical protein
MSFNLPNFEHENGLSLVALPNTRTSTQRGYDVRNARYFQEKAERCRLMSALATKPEIKRQLRLWAREFEDLADTIEIEDQLELERQESYGG